LNVPNRSSAEVRISNWAYNRNQTYQLLVPAVRPVGWTADAAAVSSPASCCRSPRPGTPFRGRHPDRGFDRPQLPASTVSLRNIAWAHGHRSRPTLADAAWTIGTRPPVRPGGCHRTGLAVRTEQRFAHPAYLPAPHTIEGEDPCRYLGGGCLLDDAGEDVDGDGQDHGSEQVGEECVMEPVRRMVWACMSVSETWNVIPTVKAT
jgi:hypothetical protein